VTTGWVKVDQVSKSYKYYVTMVTTELLYFTFMCYDIQLQ